MDQKVVELLPQSDQDKALDIPHADRWEQLKPVILKLWLGRYGKDGKDATMKQVADFMRTHYSFHAATNEYPRHFRAWNLTRRVEKDTKDGVINALVRRKRPISDSNVTTQKYGYETTIHPHKLSRHWKEVNRRRHGDTVTAELLSIWNLPYDAFITAYSKGTAVSSPYRHSTSTPENSSVQSPGPSTPGREVAGPSSQVQFDLQQIKNYRTTLFLQGKLDGLMNSMCREDRKLFVNYLHEFYIHGMSLARNLGRVPEDTRIIPLCGQIAPGATSRGSPMSPSFFLDLSPNPSVCESPNRPDVFTAPSQLCKWAIHIRRFNILQQIRPHKTESNKYSLTAELHHSISSNSFTNIPSNDLLFDKESFMRAIDDQPEALKRDAWRFAIMAGNWALLSELHSTPDVREELGSIHPFHLAASHLNGAHSCCKVFTTLAMIFGPNYAFFHNIDNFGHTILDALMISVLRSHTSVHPSAVSYTFRPPNRFPGEEVDICGRWDEQTPEVRQLFDQGCARIPTNWKHPFCHTSVQAICHSIISIYTPVISGADINAPSGLFIRRCTVCGLELRLGPLHVLVITAFYLAQLGRPGETLFGAIAVLVCLLSLGANPCREADISIGEIIGTPQSEPAQCQHAKMSPLDLMQRVPADTMKYWTNDSRIGWNCFALVLGRAETNKVQASLAGMRKQQSHERSDENSSEFSSDDDASVIGFDNESNDCECEKFRKLRRVYNGQHDKMNIVCHSANIGLLWAAIQSEMLAYRRNEVGDSWISGNFSMSALEAWMTDPSLGFSTPLIQNKLMRRHSRCGWFYDAHDWAYPDVDDCLRRGSESVLFGERMTMMEEPLLSTVWAIWELREDESVPEDRKLEIYCKAMQKMLYGPSGEQTPTP
ncbi:hypothetical protein F4803DRAFT_500532 [Xylaria telfairii]|nr:hypothetical protein F4803DRAFT_500532 [Xylaria telfairii]